MDLHLDSSFYFIFSLFRHKKMFFQIKRDSITTLILFFLLDKEKVRILTEPSILDSLWSLTLFCNGQFSGKEYYVFANSSIWKYREKVNSIIWLHYIVLKYLLSICHLKILNMKTLGVHMVICVSVPQSFWCNQKFWEDFRSWSSNSRALPTLPLMVLLPRFRVQVTLIRWKLNRCIISSVLMMRHILCLSNDKI